LIEPILNLLEVLLRNERSVAGGNANSEAGVRAEVRTIPKDVSYCDHTPESSATGTQPFVIEFAGDSTDSKIVLQVEAEYIPDNGTLLGHNRKPLHWSHAVSERRASHRLSFDGHLAHGGLDLVAQAPPRTLFAPSAKQRRRYVVTVIRANHRDAKRQYLEVAPSDLCQTIPEAIRGWYNYYKEASG
jgi:hypothetical protein